MDGLGLLNIILPNGDANPLDDDVVLLKSMLFAALERVTALSGCYEVV